VALAQRLIELHPWADMARFARSGGEANAISIRIARAASGRDGVALCGYHGWHDWYLAANLANERNLDGHQLPGLSTDGVPKGLAGSVHPFAYNDLMALEALVNSHDIGVIKMEVSRNYGPQEGFLESVREIATRNGIVLIFDECTSGFRQSFGGLHKVFGVEPDMAVFGKALGNGFAMTGVIGKREVMEAAQTTFISSTYWTERIGPTAALATLAVMERERSWEKITATGNAIVARWKTLADKHGLTMTTAGLPALSSFAFKSPNNQAYRTLISQEMLAKGYLAANLVYTCTEHTPDIVEGYFEALDPIFGLIRECEDGRDVASLLKGPIAHTTFARLN
jgi:glutamate-1-semialdehyde aminotransferase